MLKRYEISKPNSCLNRAADYEMIFVLLERDLASPVAIRAWVAERIRLGLNTCDDMQILEALKCAKFMEAGQKWI